MSRLKRHQLPRWAVRFDGELIGRIEATRIGGARNVFYFAWGLHPRTGREVRLEGDTSFDDRVDVVRRFHLDPMAFSQHLSIRHSRVLRSDTDR